MKTFKKYLTEQNDGVGKDSSSETTPKKYVVNMSINTNFEGVFQASSEEEAIEMMYKVMMEKVFTSGSEYFRKNGVQLLYREVAESHIDTDASGDNKENISVAERD